MDKRSTTSLASYNNDWYKKPAQRWKIFLWYFINSFFINSYIIPFASIKKKILQIFGAQIDKNVLIKPAVNIKYPWLLEIGEYTWIGEKVWIDNLTKVKIGANVCISQEAMLLTGNHNYKKSSFDLIVGEIVIEDGAWIGAKAIVCPGVTCGSHSILTVGSVATSDLEPYTIYQGNPARPIRKRVIDDNLK